MDGSLNLSNIVPPLIPTSSNAQPVNSTPVQKSSLSLLSLLGVKRPGSAFAKTSAKKPKLVIPLLGPTSTINLGTGPLEKEDSGLDKSGLDPTNTSCGKLLDEDMSQFDFSTPMHSMDGNVSLVSLPCFQGAPCC